ncbi:MAG: nucleotide sugar dehydrogenase [Chloroflexota bacterium]
MSLTNLQHLIETKQAVIGVIGLGYVGLPVAGRLAQVGFRVIGVDVKAERVALINAGRNPIDGDEPGLAELLAAVTATLTPAPLPGRERGGSQPDRAGLSFYTTTEYQELAQADVVLIDVETPVDADHTPRYEALKNACRSLGAVMKKGTLVIVESTVAPGTTGQVIRPLLEEASGWQADRDFFLGACPERVMPGKLLLNLRTMSRVCGGGTPETAAAMVAFYRHLVEADLDVADIVTAEVVKTAENAYRDVQIAFANEVALICEAVGADVWQVRELVNKVPYRQMHLPGAGVGGHCIPKDPWLLAYGAAGRAPVRLIPAARAINDGMPHHVADLTIEALQAAGVPLDQARVAVLGYAYLADSDDTRHSPSEALVGRLRELGLQVAIHDPWVRAYQGDLWALLSGCDAAVVMVAHRAYYDLDSNRLATTLRTPILIDGRHVSQADKAQAAGLFYRAVGQGDNGNVKRET